MDTCKTLPQLLEDHRHYRRILGWIFITRSDNPLCRMALASRYLQEQDEELLAWIVQNLTQTWALRGTSWRVAQAFFGKCFPNPNLPEAKEARKALFGQLQEPAAFIGNKKRTLVICCDNHIIRGIL